nr:YcaO-like family protein [Gammaproteobacteria bacterium]
MHLRDKSRTLSPSRYSELEFCPGVYSEWKKGTQYLTRAGICSISLDEDSERVVNCISKNERQKIIGGERTVTLALIEKRIIQSARHSLPQRTQTLLADSCLSARQLEFRLNANPFKVEICDVALASGLKRSIRHLGGKIKRRAFPQTIFIYVFRANQIEQRHVSDGALKTPSIVAVVDAIGATLYLITKKDRAHKYLQLLVASKAFDRLALTEHHYHGIDANGLAEAIVQSAYGGNARKVMRHSVSPVDFDLRKRAGGFLNAASTLQNDIHSMRVDNLINGASITRAILSSRVGEAESVSISTIGLSRSSSQAITIAYAEYCERRAVFQAAESCACFTNGFLAGEDLVTHEQVLTPSQEILLFSEGHPHFDPRSDTSGTAFDFSSEVARCKAVMELIERHVTSLWWFGTKGISPYRLSQATLKSVLGTHMEKPRNEFVVFDISVLGGPFVYVVATQSGDEILTASHSGSDWKLTLRKALYDLISMQDLSDRQRDLGLDGYGFDSDDISMEVRGVFVEPELRLTEKAHMKLLEGLASDWDIQVCVYDITPANLRGTVARARCDDLLNLFKPNQTVMLDRHWSRLPWYGPCRGEDIDSVVPYKVQERALLR